MYNMNKKGKRHYYYAPINAPINIQSPINVMPGGGGNAGHGVGI